jgi:hypothetical protein
MLKFVTNTNKVQKYFKKSFPIEIVTNSKVTKAPNFGGK